MMLNCEREILNAMGENYIAMTNSETEQQDSTFYHISVYHTGTLTGAPDLHEEQVSASSEQQALERAKIRSGWPEEEYYDEDEDVEIKELS